MATELVYSSKKLSVDDLSESLDELWAEIKRPDSELHQQAKEAGIDVEALSTLDRDEIITVERPSSGFADTELLIIIGKALAPVVAKIAIDLWDSFLLPRIRKNKGKDALIKKKED
jgi:hypothetical protein